MSRLSKVEMGAKSQSPSEDSCSSDLWAPRHRVLDGGQASQSPSEDSCSSDLFFAALLGVAYNTASQSPSEDSCSSDGALWGWVGCTVEQSQSPSEDSCSSDAEKVTWTEVNAPCCHSPLPRIHAHLTLWRIDQAGNQIFVTVPFRRFMLI